MAVAFVRGKVSKNKRRYIDKRNGFDLDLAYIKPSIVAMGFPSEGMEGAYRNPYSEVYRLFELKHHDHYKVYNLCSERSYDPGKFHNRVGLYPFDDHNAPPFEMIEAFCKDVKEWLERDEQNVAVTHCKAGKGRTGLMICSYLLYSGEWSNADDAMSFYAAMRTFNKKGVTIPSQIRYIRYFEQYLKSGSQLQAKQLAIQRLVLYDGALVVRDGAMRVTIFQNGSQIYPPKNSKKEAVMEEGPSNSLSFVIGDVAVTGDIKIEFDDKARLGSVTELFHFWFNTAFIDSSRLMLTKSQLDKAHKDKGHKTFSKNFAVEVIFSDVDMKKKAQARASKINLNPLSASTADGGPNTPEAAKFSDIIDKYPSLLNI